MLRIVFMVALVISFLSQVVLAAPKWVRVSISGDATTTATVSWNTTGAADSQVEYGPDANYGSTAGGTSENVGGEIGVVHTVTLTGLTPDTQYHYRAGSPGDFSSDHVFHTAPADVCQPISFGFAADNRGDFSGSSACWPQVYEALANQGAAFVINSGDLVKEGQNADEWADFLDKSEPYMGEIFLVPALGNHDDDDVDGDGALYNQIFALPRNSVSSTEDFYSFDYGNVHFVALSTQTFKGGTSNYQMQADWLSADLANTDRMWKVVYFHKPPYSSGGHGSNEDGQNPVFIPIFDQYHVDLVVTGHDHIYERFRPLVGWPQQEVSSYNEGTCYIVSGGGGAATIPFYFPREDGAELGDTKHHYVAVTVANNVMHIRAERVPTQCLTLGTGGSGVIDEFDIIKTLGPGEDPCQGPTDVDQDGFSPPVDCDDGNPNIHPGAPEICGDDIDQDCDGSDKACPCQDADQDGSQDSACGGNDCNDNDASIHPGATEVCQDGIDNDCDGQTDEADCGNCVDSDGDGYHAPGVDCPSGNDCDDGNPDVNPGATEVCNGVDDDCNDQTDEGDICTGDCVDDDNDGYHAEDTDCSTGDDCDDTDPGIHPGAEEICGDGKDQDCSGQDLECGCADADQDGHSDKACGGQDCDDSDSNVHPDAIEGCNETDDDCDGMIDEDDVCADDGCGCYSGSNHATAVAGLLMLMLGIAARRKRNR